MLWKEAFLHWAHLMAAIVWLGGMIFTAFLLNPVLRSALPAQERLALFKALGLRFKRVEWGCLATLIATGLYKLHSLGSWSQAFSGDFGRVLSVKLSLVAVMLVLSFLHTFVWGPRLGEAGLDPETAARLSRQTVLWARVNLLAGLAVVLCAALMRVNPF